MGRSAERLNVIALVEHLAIDMVKKVSSAEQAVCLGLVVQVEQASRVCSANSVNVIVRGGRLSSALC